MGFSGSGASMAEWIPCGGDFIQADVIRWKEGVWEKRSRRRNARAINVGGRNVVAEVLSIDKEGWVRLLIRDNAVTHEMPGRRIAPLPKIQEIRRKRSTILRGKPERLLWSDESARAVLASKFLGNK